MAEQIYINGVFMQREAGASPAALVWQTPFFTDPDSIVSNRSNSVEFPATRHNLKALRGEADYAYRAHTVTYCLDGVRLFTGRATLLSVTPTSLSFSFTWGNVSAFQKLLDLNLRDLPGEYVKWDYDTMTTDVDHYDPYMDFGAGSSAKDADGNYLYVNHPFVKVSGIIAALEAASGVAIEGADAFAGYVIPCVTKQQDDYARRRNGIVRTSTEAASFVWPKVSGLFTTYHLFLTYTGDDDPRGMAIGDKGAIDVSGIDTLHIVIPSGGLDMQLGADTFYGLAVATVEDEDCDNVTGWLWSGGTFETFTLSDGSKEAVLTEDIDIRVDVSGCDFVALQVAKSFVSENDGAVSAAFPTAPEVRIYDDDDAEVPYGGTFPLTANLPDWTGSQLLKNLMKAEGLFAVCPDSSTVRFVPVTTLHDNRGGAPDWTERLMLTGGRPTEKTTTFGSFARANRFKWADDDTVTGSYDGTMTVDDESLDAETDLVTMDFAATDTNASGNPVIRAYTKSVDDDGAVSVEFREVTPRLLQLVSVSGPVRTSFARIDFATVLRNKYAAYAATVLHPEVVKASVRVAAYELQTLDLSVPVYSHQLRGYYAITKLTTKKGGTAEVELLRLGAYSGETVSLPTEVTDLCVVDDGDTIATRIPSLNEATEAAMKASDDYKVVLLRYGYARRGKLVKDESRGIDTNTHRKNFRLYRHGLQWRIIGEEKLRTGKLSEHSQALGTYGESTLVMPLGTRILLPRSNVRTSKNGYVSNSARDGLCELWVALYHRSGGKWKCISNKVQVRGISSDHKKVWDYTTNNISYEAE